ncbi:TraB/GumN family protein [Flavobacterium cerinum]|uniref:TraB/GumN family protein n=1 Tax=Flavobacterium cerinum TaxID=2502784 RepID=UPI00374418BB
MPGLVKNNSCFIAVGLAHLRYKCGLIEQLRYLGYSVERVTMKSQILKHSKNQLKALNGLFLF